MQRFSMSAIVLAALLGGCVGMTTPPGGDPGGSETRCDGDGGGCPPLVMPPGTTTPPPPCDGVCVGESRLTRLTRAEYRNTVFDLLGVEIEEERLPQDQELYGTFFTNQEGEVTVDDVNRYLSMAEDIVASLDLTDLTACAEEESQLECERRFVESFGERAHRRPLSAEDAEGYMDLYEWARGDGDTFVDATGLVLSAMLQSPSFLYRVEMAEDSATPTLLDGYALASRLSYFLWQSAPDEELMAAAAAGRLATREEVETQARRMFSDARADAMIRRFHRNWLGIADLDQLRRVDPAFTPELGAAMQEETESFAVHVFREAGGDLGTLLGADYSIVDATLASFYEVDPPSIGWESRALPERRGVMTHASVMAANAADSAADPVYRGKFVLIRLLCQELQPRPDGVDDAVMNAEMELTDDMTERERLERLTISSDCQGCHGIMNPPGFVFSRFDSTGRLRTADREGFDIDTGVEIVGSGAYGSDLNGSYLDASDFADAAARSVSVARCMTAQWMRFALGRPVNDEVTSFSEAYRRFDGSDRDLRELVIAITTSDAFRHRRPPAALAMD